jgi:hypothetical protein
MRVADTTSTAPTGTLPVTFAAVLVLLCLFFFLLAHWLEAVCWKAVVTAEPFSTGPSSVPELVLMDGLGVELGDGLGEPVPVLLPPLGDFELGGGWSVLCGLGEHVEELDGAGDPVDEPLEPIGLVVFDSGVPPPVRLPGPLRDFCECRPAVLLMKSEVLNAT